MPHCIVEYYISRKEIPSLISKPWQDANAVLIPYRQWKLSSRHRHEASPILVFQWY